jgi:hypothetical protein
MPNSRGSRSPWRRKLKPWRNITLAESRKRIFLKMWLLCPRCADFYTYLVQKLSKLALIIQRIPFVNPRSTHRSSCIHCIILWTSLPVSYYLSGQWSITYIVHASQHSRLRIANYKCTIVVRRIGTEKDRVCSIIIACCGGIDIVSLTGFAACWV